MVRVLGASIFGIIADRHGRKLPFIFNVFLLIIFEMATGFCTSYPSFVACRILFGVAMGGLYGNAASTALEDCPQESRGLISGALQSGYPFGFLLATVSKYALADSTIHGFWFGACPPVFIMYFRYKLPETGPYRDRMRRRSEHRGIKAVLLESKDGVKSHGFIVLYLTVFVAALTFIASHFVQYH